MSLLTVAQVARILQCSEDAVTRRFASYKGVIDLGRAEDGRKRRYRVLRIPVAVVEKYLVEKSGAPVKIEVPPAPERRRKTPDWERRAILNLAKAGKQNGCEDRTAYRRIAERARLLAAKVPESYWPEIQWSADEDE